MSLPSATRHSSKHLTIEGEHCGCTWPEECAHRAGLPLGSFWPRSQVCDKVWSVQTILQEHQGMNTSFRRASLSICSACARPPQQRPEDVCPKCLLPHAWKGLLYPSIVLHICYRKTFHALCKEGFLCQLAIAVFGLFRFVSQYPGDISLP